MSALHLLDGIVRIGDIVYDNDFKLTPVKIINIDIPIVTIEYKNGSRKQVVYDTLRKFNETHTKDVISIADEMRPKEVIKRTLTLPIDSAERKNYPLLSGLFNYFPAALAGVANTSKLGNDKHNPGQPLHHARGKSMDHGDCILRHLMDTENLKANLNLEGSTVTPAEILLEANQMVWRALAYSQALHEQFGAPLAPAAKE